LADGREAKLIDGNRNRVVWVGRQIPHELKEVVKILGLSVEALRNLNRLDPRAADLFALIVSAQDDDVTKALGRLLRLSKVMHLLDYGVLLGAASRDPATAYTLQTDLRIRTQLQISALGFTRDEFARTLRSHQAGPPANPSLTPPLVGHDQEYDPPEDYELDSILLRRAFDGFVRVSLKPEQGGYSKDCKVWRIEAFKETGRCQPFVAKAARRDDLQAEFETYCAFVRDSIPFPFRAPLLESRFVKGATRAILVSAFVSRAQRLDEYLAIATSPELVMLSLFDGALGAWRRDVESEYISLGHFYVQQHKALAESTTPEERSKKALLPDPEGLTVAFEESRKQDTQLLSPSQVWERLDRLPAKPHFFCRVHGDLNIRNVFVRWNSIDTILIDFSHAGIRESVARDPAKLETSISLTARDSTQQLLPETVLRQLYRGRLLPPRNFVEFDSRTDAIRQIRRHAGGEGVSTDEYEVLTICHLLRFACVPVNKQRDQMEMEKRRVISYALACDILKNL
jgi:hypothetical protein